MKQSSARVVGEGVYIAPTAYVGGDVILGEHCTIMHHVSIRGDVAPIRLGQRVNVQDGAVLHTDLDVPLEIADDVSIGHRAVVHCRSVGAGTLIGIGAILLDGAVVGKGCLVAAGAVVVQGTEIPDGTVAVGAPARVRRELTDQERAYLRQAVDCYVALGARHQAGEFPNIASGQLRG